MQTGAIFEVLGVLLAGILLQRAVQATLGLGSWKTLQASMLDSDRTDFLLLARAAFIEQILKYGFALGLAFAIGWWHRRRPVKRYGLTRGGRSLASLVVIGVVAYAAAGIFPMLLRWSSHFLPLGTGPEHWRLFPEAWSWSFLLYMAVASFVLVPIVEELLARGYFVTRLAEEFGTGGGILLSAFFFAFAHGQYLKLEVLSLGMSLGLLLGSLVYGYVFWRTRSVLPVILAHGLVNIPMPAGLRGDGLILLLMIAVLVIARRPLKAWLLDLLATLRTDTRADTLLGVLLLGAVFALLLLTRSLVVAAGVGMLLIALLIAWWDRSRRRAWDGRRCV